MYTLRAWMAQQVVPYLNIAHNLPYGLPARDDCGSWFGVAKVKQTPQWIEFLADRAPEWLRGAGCCGCTLESRSARASISAPPRPVSGRPDEEITNG